MDGVEEGSMAGSMSEPARVALLAAELNAAGVNTRSSYSQAVERIVAVIRDRRESVRLVVCVRNRCRKQGQPMRRRQPVAI